MKFVVTSRVNNLNGCTLPLGVASTQEIHLSNSRATIKTLRAVIAIKFKLPPMSFDMVYMGTKTDVQWNDESNVIEASGLEDGDRMWVLPKDVDLSDVLKSDAAEEQKQKETISHSKSTSETTTNNEIVQKSERVDRTSPPLKVFRTESSAVTDDQKQIGQGKENTTCIDAQNIINNKANPTATTTLTEKVETNTEKASTENNQIREDDKHSSSTNVNESQKEEISVNKNDISNISVNDNENDNDNDGDAELGKDNEDEEEEEEMEENGPDELYERLMEVTPNLMEMREEFLAHPEEVMQRIQKEDPKLFGLITANQESFVELVNNADFVRALQDEKEAYEIDWSNDDDMEDGEFDDGEDDDINAEMNEAAVEAMHNLYLQLLAGDNARAMQHSGARSEEIGMQDNVDSSSHTGNNEVSASNIKEHDDNNNNNTNTASSSTEMAGQANVTRNFVPLQQAQISDILAYVPSEEDMRKIEGLTELGFTFDQCKVAFYSCRRSLERAANFLFESPPKLEEKASSTQIQE